jgi:hypothetical protein
MSIPSFSQRSSKTLKSCTFWHRTEVGTELYRMRELANVPPYILRGLVMVYIAGASLPALTIDGQA